MLEIEKTIRKFKVDVRNPFRRFLPELETPPVETPAEEVPAEETPAEETPPVETPEDQTVPKSRFDEVVAENQTLKEQANLAIENAKIANANRQPPKEQKPFDIYAHVGLDPEDPDDVPNQGQLKLINQHFANINKQAAVETQFLATHSDFDTIVGTEDSLATGKFAPPLQKVIETHPALLRVILNNPPEHRREAAYQIAKSHSEKTAPAVDNDAVAAAAAIKEAVDLAGKPKSAGLASGGGVLSEEGRIATMSDQDFVALMIKNGADLS